MRIQHNIMAMNAYRNYTNNVSAMKGNLEKLSSGYKINRAGDDAAGLAISEKMRAQITGLQQAQANAKSGINLVQTAEGALQEVQDMLNRMVKLAEQSANGTYDEGVDRKQLNKEFDQLKAEINRIGDSANFNGIKLLDGSMAGEGTTETTTTTSFLQMTGNVGNAELTGTDVAAATEAEAQTAVYTYKIDTALAAGDTINIAGHSYAAASGSGDIDVSEADEKEEQAEAIAAKLTTDLGSDYTVTVEGDTITVTAAEAGTDANAADMKAAVSVTATGTGVVTAAEATAGAESAQAKYTYTIGTALGTSDAEITIAGHTFEIGTGDGQIDLSGKTSAGDQAGVIKTALEAALQADDATKDKYSVTVSGAVITVEAADNGVDENATAMKDDVVISKAGTGAATATEETEGTDAVTESEAHKSYDLSGVADGDTVTIDGVTYEFDDDNDVTEGNTAVADVDALKAALQDKNITLDDADPAAVTISKTTSKTSTSGGALKLQIGDTAHTYNKIKVSIKSIKSESLIDLTTQQELKDKKPVTAEDANGDPLTEVLSLEDIKVDTQDNAAVALSALKGMVNYISDIRGELGATQNRLNHTINNLSVMTENIQDAESTIRDTDVADEMMAYTKNNILIQSAQAMLAQANQVPQGVLQLLQ